MLMNRDQVIAKIQSGAKLSLAGDESLLAGLPKGDWIGGSIPYFMDEAGGVNTRERIFVQEFKDGVTDVDIRCYGAAELKNIPRDSPDCGFSLVIIPAMSPAHIQYAQEAPDYDGLFLKQIVGWIAGVDVADIGKVMPKVFDGRTGTSSTDQIVVMHVSFIEGLAARIGIINLFKQGAGDTIEFQADGFQVENCMVNGQLQNFAEYLTSKAIDTRLPLVADYNGEMINVSFQKVDATAGTVDLFAPVFRHVRYRIAAPVADYAKEFREKALSGNMQPIFTCNCILNYLYGELEGKQTGTFHGPITFGEVAYQLVNQTLVYLVVDDLR